MGWWTQNEQGHSFAKAKGDELLWGDNVADILDGAIDSITDEFDKAYDRKPTKAELRAGLEFSLGGLKGEQ